MLHEIAAGSDGTRRFTAKCESSTVCNAVKPHSLRSVGHIFCHLCCKTDHCNNKCGVTPTTTAPHTPAPSTARPTTTHAPTTHAPTTHAPTTHKPTTHAPTTHAPTTHKPTTHAPTTPVPTTLAPPVPTPHKTQTPPTRPHTIATTSSSSSLMCYNCDNMADPQWCSHITICPAGHGCMVREVGTDSNGHKIYRSYCEKDVMCYAYAMYGNGKRDVDIDDGSHGYVIDVDVDGSEVGDVGYSDVGRMKRAGGCARCCYTNLCNNDCKGPPTIAPPTRAATTTVAPTLPPTTVEPYLTASKHPLTLNYKGCFTDYNGQRLPYAHISDSHMTIEKCIAHCKTQGYMYAGVKSRTQCHCGDDYTHAQIQPSTDSQCDTVCAGNGSQFCGSVLHVSVYETTSLCYSCNHELHPGDCTKVVKCATDEECILYQTDDPLLFGGKQYHAGCALKRVCNTLGTMVTSTSPSAADFCHVCCDTPLCNNVCTNTPNQIVTHAPITTPPPGPTPTTAGVTVQHTQHPHTTHNPVQSQQLCETDHFSYIPNVHLCYKIETFAYNRAFALRWCEIESATLASLYDQGKFSILQMLLKFDPQFANNYIYIGGYDVNSNGDFYWPTGERIVPGSWSGLPSSGSGRCLVFDGSNNFNIKLVNCSEAHKFICTKEV